ncbi:MAG: hypothetical protein L6R41_006830 [Letrouitia leprolyta]|nr:MAG: hypothetical protein L6R41_006830 [Letrouitia leprolyta]
MATVIANKPAPPHQKMKRPPPPAVQTNVNGVKSSHSSPSPSLSSKRPPTTFQHLQNGNTGASSGLSTNVNGAMSRLNNRRRDSQKPSDLQPRPNRPGKGGVGDNVLDRRKKMAEPHVKAPSYILKKYKNKPPSLILHLHPTHFRFDQQDGSFSYNSPMKIMLEHLRSQTVPHDIVEELNAASVRFYEGCLIVQVQDHRRSTADSEAAAAAKANDKNVPFSIHNHTPYLIPSPFVPYPKPTIADDETIQAKPGRNPYKIHRGPKMFTTVLFPTPQSVEEEVFAWANTPDPRSNNRKQSQASAASRTPASATMPHPPAPLSAVPSTPTTGPPNKKQKMLLGDSDIRNFQSKLTSSTAPPLFLDPVDNLEEASKLIESLTDAFHKGPLPSPKTRKRTVAELEADEALAASEQRFMLIMDERLSNLGASTKANGGDGEAGAAAFEPRFERFKTIENIKAAHREREQQLQEQRAISQAQQQAANKIKAEQAEQQKLMQEKKAADLAQRQEQHLRSFQAMQNGPPKAQTLAALQHQQQQQLAASQNMHGHGPTSNGILTNQQNMPPNTQPQHSSPIARNMTPHSNPRSSPLVGNVPHSVPMNVTTSTQGVTSSPIRPSSSAQHGHPVGGVAMGPNRSQQRPPSRMGTPSMPNGTPNIQHGTPVIKQGTPVPNPRMNHGSPPHAMSQTPMMNANGIAAQHINMHNLTPEQAHQLERFKQQQQHQQRQAFLQQQHNMANGMSPNHGMSPMHMPPQNPNLQHLAAQNQQNIRHYQAQQQEYHRQMNGGGATANDTPNPNTHMLTSAVPNPHARPMPPQPPHPSSTGGGGPPGAGGPGGGGGPSPQHIQHQQQMIANRQRMATMQMELTNRAYQSYMKGLMQEFGNNVPQEKMAEARQKASLQATQMIARQQQQQRYRQQQILAAHMAGQGGGGGGGAGGMMGMNGMGGMGGMMGG